MSNIVLKTAPVIEHKGLQGMGELVGKRIKALNIDNLVATPESLTAIKKMRSTLNAEFKTYEEQRKAIKTGVSNPYLLFDTEYKLHISAHYSEADTKLKEKVLSVESELKLQREETLKQFFIETCQANKIDFVTFDKVGLNITMSPSMKSFKDKITNFVEDIAKEIKLIDTLDVTDGYRMDVLVEYKKNFDLTESIKIVKKRKEDKAAEAAKRVVVTPVAPIVEKPVETIPEPVVENNAPLHAPTVESPEEVFEMSFSVKGTMHQLKVLKAFLIEIKIEFKNID